MSAAIGQLLERLRRTRVIAIAVAIAAVLSTGACVPGAGQGSMTVTAYFPDSAGLFEGNDVGILGVPVGTITDIVPDGNRVKVTMELDRDQPVPADAGAVVVARSVATDRYVELTPVYKKGPTLADGAVIEQERTRTPVDFDEVLEALDVFATGIAGSKESREAVRRIVDEGSAALAGNGGRLNRTVDELAGAADGVSAQRQEIGTTLTSLDTLAKDINGNQATIREFIHQVALGTELLSDQRQEFRTALRTLDTAMADIAQFSVTNRDEVVKVLNGASRAMRTVNAKQQDVATILETLPLALQNLERAQDGRRLRVRIDPTILLPLGALVRQLCESLPLGLCELVDGTGLVGQVLTPLGSLLSGLPLGKEDTR